MNLSVSSSLARLRTTAAQCAQLPLHLIEPVSHQHRKRHPRIGAVARSLLATVAGGALLLTAASVLDPAALQAGSPASTPSASIARKANMELLAGIAQVIHTAHAVMDVRPRQGERGCEIILWLRDEHDPQRVNADELALIRHSPLFQTVTLYTVPPDAMPRTERMFNDAGSVIDIAAPGFIDRWRAESCVQARVLATGISDLRADPIVSADSKAGVRTVRAGGGAEGMNRAGGEARFSVLRLSMRWSLTSAGDWVDDSETAAVIVAPSQQVLRHASQR